MQVPGFRVVSGVQSVVFARSVCLPGVLQVGKVRAAISYQFSTNCLRRYIAYSAEINYVADIFRTPFQNPSTGGWLL